MFSLIGSCLLQAVDPQVYLTDVMSRLPSHPANHELTPMAWRLARLDASRGLHPVWNDGPDAAADWIRPYRFPPCSLKSHFADGPRSTSRSEMVAMGRREHSVR
jgi:hypothetical protein